MTMKTNKSVSKRFKITRKKMVLFRPMHQDHYNAKDPGDKTRQKRKMKTLGGTIKNQIIKKYLPYL